MQKSTALIDLISEDKEVISYRKSLRPITGSVTATILLQQMMWHGRNKKWEVFYKFKAPCGHELYKPGDSWTEELGFSIKEFDSALSKIGTKITGGTKKSDVLETGDLDANRLVAYWTDASRITWYQINRDLLGKVLKGIYLVSDQREFTRKVTKGDLSITETPTETPTDTKSSSDDDFSKPDTSDERDGRVVLELLRAHPQIMYKDQNASYLAMQLEQDYEIDDIRLAMCKMATAHDAMADKGKNGIVAPLAYIKKILVTELGQVTKRDMVTVKITTVGSRGDRYDEFVRMDAAKAKAAGYEIVGATA